MGPRSHSPAGLADYRHSYCDKRYLQPLSLPAVNTHHAHLILPLPSAFRWQERTQARETPHVYQRIKIKAGGAKIKIGLGSRLSYLGVVPRHQHPCRPSKLPRQVEVILVRRRGYSRQQSAPKRPEAEAAAATAATKLHQLAHTIVQESKTS